MGIANYHISSRLYFSKWSNTAYAVFHSIGKEVIIGEISAILNQLNTVKSAIVNFIYPEAGKNLSQDEAEQEGLTPNQLLLDAELNLVIQLVNHSDIISSDLKGTYNTIILIYQKALSGPFFILVLKSNLKRQVSF